VLLADDHDVVRQGIRTLLEERGGWEICGEATTGTEAVRLSAQMQPDVVVIDLEMDDLDGVTATRQIKLRHSEVEVLIFTMHNDEFLFRDAISAGARGFVLKSEGGHALVRALESVSSHQPFFAPGASETLLNSFLRVPTSSPNVVSLTDREREIVRLLAGGKSNKEIAVALGISVKTVETHRAAIMRKLGFSSIVTLVRYAVREHLIKA
jgi:DNA-binding NarL/FixJ family response regulator